MHQLMRLWSEYDKLIFAPLKQLKRWPIQTKKYIFSLNLAQI